MATRKLGSIKRTDTVLITSVNLGSAEVTGTLGVANGGTGLTSGTSGGVLAFTAAGTIVSSAALAANGVVIGGGAGVAPSTIATANNGVLVTSEAGVPSIATDIPTAVTIGSKYIYRADGNDVAVADGGTGLSAGTSGGILGYTAEGTLASSVLLTQYALILGGGVGATPTAMASLGTTAQVLHGNAAGAPTWGAIAAADIDSAIGVLLCSLSWGSPGAEADDTIEVTGTVKSLANVTVEAATTEIEIVVSDSATDAEPSATATIGEADVPAGTLLAGNGTATTIWRTSATGTVAVAVTETAEASRFLWARTGMNSQAWVRAAAGPLELEFE